MGASASWLHCAMAAMTVGHKFYIPPNGNLLYFSGEHQMNFVHSILDSAAIGSTTHSPFDSTTKPASLNDR